MTRLRRAIAHATPGIDRLAQRYGWRGLTLILLGSQWFVIGLGVMLQPQRGRSLVLTDYVPDIPLGLCWWVTGGIAIWQGLRGKHRDDSAGHVALFLMPAVRCGAFFVAWATYWITRGLSNFTAIEPVGYRNGLLAGLVWAVVVVVVLIVARRPESVLPVPEPPGAGHVE